MNNKLSRWWKEEFMPSRKSDTSSSRLLRQIAKVVGYLVLVAVCWFVVWRIRLSNDLNSKFARIRAAGLPVSGAELNAWRAPVPDAENGALVLTQAFALWRIFPDRRSNEVYHANILNRTNEWSAETRGLIEAYVQINLMALAKAREAFLHSRFRYPVDFSYGPETPMPHLGAIRDLARVAAFEASLNAENGAAQAWPELVQLQLKIAS